MDHDTSQRKRKQQQSFSSRLKLNQVSYPLGKANFSLFLFLYTLSLSLLLCRDLCPYATPPQLSFSFGRSSGYGQIFFLFLVILLLCSFYCLQTLIVYLTGVFQNFYFIGGFVPNLFRSRIFSSFSRRSFHTRIRSGSFCKNFS